MSDVLSLQRCIITSLHHYSAASLQRCIITALHHYSAASLPRCIITALHHYSAAAAFWDRDVLKLLDDRWMLNTYHIRKLSYEEATT